MNATKLTGKAAIDYVRTTLRPSMDEPVRGLAIANNEVDGDAVDNATLSHAIDACDEDPSLVTYTTEDTAMIYELKFENEISSGTKNVRAESEAEALAKFRASYEEHGDEVPSCWVVGTWAVTA